jgi:hypothetical protein
MSATHSAAPRGVMTSIQVLLFQLIRSNRCDAGPVYRQIRQEVPLATATQIGLCADALIERQTLAEGP